MTRNIKNCDARHNLPTSALALIESNQRITKSLVFGLMTFSYKKYSCIGAYGIGRLPNVRVGLVQTLHPADLKRGKADLAPAQNEAFHGEGHLSLTLTVITDYESSCLPSGGPPALSKILYS